MPKHLWKLQTSQLAQNRMHVYVDRRFDVEGDLERHDEVLRQAVGGAAGNIICIHNIVAASAVVGLVGREGAVIRKTFFPFVYYAGTAGCLGYAIVWNAQKGWLNLGAILLAGGLGGLWWFANQQLRADKK